jgi:hypothetical protein
MHADHFYTIGAGHEVCQDYAASGPDFAVLSDGCSSAAHSDWGARMLTRAAFNHLIEGRPLWSPYDLELPMTYVERARLALSLPSSCLRATLAYIQKTPDDKKLSATIFGDGYVAARLRETKQIRQFFKLEYTSGAPYYPCYGMSARAHEQYMEEFGDGVLRVTGDDEGSPIDYKIDEQWGSHFMRWDFNRDEYDLVAVFSDGLGQFASPRENIEDMLALCSFVAFKSLAGRFVQRRCRKAFEEFKKNLITCRDDFSMAAVYDPDPNT